MVKITERRTRQDWALFLQDIAEQYPKAEKNLRIMDNLNIHAPDPLYETYVPEMTKALWDRFEFPYMPKHGSRLNMAEIELSVLARQGLSRRIDTIREVWAEVKAWENARNNKSAKVNWQFTTGETRIKLVRPYTTLEN